MPHGAIKMLKNIAILIDADNIGSQKIDWIFDKISTLGSITTKRIYGDFTKPHLSSWESSILKYAIEKKHQTSYSSGKNSSDIALAIDTMDLLYTNKCDGFCIVSSDSDFIGLSLRLRQNNIQVFGFGESKTITAFRQACSQFFEIPNAQTVLIPQTKVATQKYTATQLKCDTKLLNALRDSIDNNKADKDGWVNYAIFVSYFQKNYSNICPEYYGYNKLYEIIDNIDLYEHKKENSTIFVRKKTSDTRTSSQSNTQHSATQLSQNHQLINAIKDSINKNLENGWANFSAFTQYLHAHYPYIKPKNHGYAKWRTLINRIDLFEIKQVNQTSLFIKEKINNTVTPTPNIKKIENQQLLDDILEIINTNNLRIDEWIHIGQLGTQLKIKGYNPKDFGFKSFRALLENTQGVTIKHTDPSTICFSLADQSQILPIPSNAQ